MKVCDKTCIFFFFPIINKYFLMAKRSLLSRCHSCINIYIYIYIYIYVSTQINNIVHVYLKELNVTRTYYILYVVVHRCQKRSLSREEKKKY